MVVGASREHPLGAALRASRLSGASLPLRLPVTFLAPPGAVLREMLSGSRSR